MIRLHRFLCGRCQRGEAWPVSLLRHQRIRSERADRRALVLAVARGGQIRRVA